MCFPHFTALLGDFIFLVLAFVFGCEQITWLFSIKHSDRKSRMLNSFPGSFFNTTEEESGHQPSFLPTEMLEQRETSGAVRTGKLSLTCLWTRSDPSLF